MTEVLLDLAPIVAFLLMVSLHHVARYTGKRNWSAVTRIVGAIGCIAATYSFYVGYSMLGTYHVNWSEPPDQSTAQVAARVAIAEHGKGTLLLVFAAFWPWVLMFFGAGMGLHYFLVAVRLEGFFDFQDKP